MKNQKQKNKESVTTIPQLVKIMRDSFQSNQDLFIGEITSLRTEIRDGFKQTKENFTEMKKQIDNLSKNTVDVIHQEDFDKLESRVVEVEEVVDLRLKKS